MIIQVVSLTKKSSKEFEDTPLYKSIHKCAIANPQDIWRYNITYNNTTPICKAYNGAVRSKQHALPDLFLFVHDDVSIEDALIGKKLATASKDYDIIGLAGATDFVPKKPALWHLCSKQYSGQVAHKEENGRVFMTNFGVSPQQVNVLDGLFLAVKSSVFFEKNVWFDESLPGFHHYDLKFCYDAIKANLKLTTWPIWCVHDSPGLKSWTPEYLESEKVFLDAINTKR